MSRITLPYGVRDEFYYEEVVAHMIPIKYCDIKPNFQNTVRDVVMGEFMPLVDSVVTMNLTTSVLFGIRRIEEWICKVDFIQKNFSWMTRNHFGNSLIQI